jgi:hypothetical protein
MISGGASACLHHSPKMGDWQVRKYQGRVGRRESRSVSAASLGRFSDDSDAVQDQPDGHHTNKLRTRLVNDCREWLTGAS